jgi:uncharacterized protein (DUF2252 family)
MAMKQSADDEHRAYGKELRKTRPPDWMASWKPDPSREPLAVLERAAVGRDPELVDERNKTMAEDDPEFFRGAAGVMASDLRTSRRETSDIWLDVCGDAHMGNFGTYGSPERHRLFDLNDFDEARSAPWEWDICRLAASAVVTARHLKFAKRRQADVAGTLCAAYAETLADLASRQLVDRWYMMTGCDSVEPGDLALRELDRRAKDLVRSAEALLTPRKIRTQETTIDELTDGSGAFHDDNGNQTPIDGKRAAEVRAALEPYRDTLPRGLRRVLSGYTATAVAKRPVGAGSLGLRNYLVLVRGRHDKDALVLQVKEATPSQLEFGLDPVPMRHEGKRVVRMQQMLQGASDPLLGWTSMRGDEAYYVRQFRDMKAAPDLDELDFARLRLLARLCGTTLARAHARSASSVDGTLVRMSGYIGGSPKEYSGFRDAVTVFADTYAAVTSGDRRVLDESRKSDVDGLPSDDGS